MVLADMKLAADTPTDVILFNIDSKSESNSKENKAAIVNVFLKAVSYTHLNVVKEFREFPENAVIYIIHGLLLYAAASTIL